jgi:ferric-dicitrate binding protein FerR (iron transport regulator)
MEDPLDALLFGHDLSPEDRSAIREQFDEHADLATAWAHWCAVRRRLRDRLEKTVSDRRLLVLYVLEQEGAEAALTAREQDALDECRDDIARAVETIPALEQIVERIRDEQAEFEAMWATHVDGDGANSSVEELDESDRRSARNRSDREPRPPASKEGGTARRWARRLAVAALVVGLAVVGVLLWPKGAATTTITVADGAVQVKALGDGSIMRLVGPATATYPSSDAQKPARRVTLTEGQAYFDVQPRSDASFVVETPTATATVLGTQFGVSTRADTTEVVLASGSVRVDDVDDAASDGVVLEPGQRSWVAKGGAPASPEAVDLTGALEWTGLFIFRSTPLDTIADRLRRQYEVRITVAESLRDEPVTGTFEREQPVSEVLGALAATLGAEVQTKGDGRYRLVPAR